ncbi:MAG: class I SAM-dependent methyltransferase [Parvibaculaceae bacterium]
MNAHTRFDADRASRFEERFVGVLNAGALCLMTSIGHRTGLFDTMSGMKASTADDIARKAGLNERYVREWLGAMVAAGVVEVDAKAGRYRLPAEHAGYLTRKSPMNFGVGTQFIPLLGSVEDDIVDCFRNGGGVPYERFGRFHEVMAEESAQTVLPVLVDQILPLADGLVGRLEKGIAAMDVGCGRGRALMQLAERFPNSSFLGLDLSEEAIGWARRRVAEKGLKNLTFQVKDLSDFDRTAPKATFDLVMTFDAIHDQPKPMAMLKGLRRALKEMGVYVAQDIKGSCHHHHNIGHPLGTMLYTISCMHCMTVSLAQNGEGLGAMWGRETAERFFREAGFSHVEVHELGHDIQNYYYVCRP